jgi:hypothetical protein
MSRIFFDELEPNAVTADFHFTTEYRFEKLSHGGVKFQGHLMALALTAALLLLGNRTRRIA